MSRPRLVMISRRFWPLVGGAEVATASLAARLAARGWPTTILTARWQADWPAEIEHRGVRVVRLHQPRQRMWGTWRYMRALDYWFRAHRDEFDLVYVSMLKHDAYAAIGAGQRDRFPVALRAEGPGLSGDVHWQLEDRFGRMIRRRTMQADALVAPSPAIHDELIAAGYPRDRIHYIPYGVVIPPPRTSEIKQQAREALADLDPALALAPDQPLAVFTGRLHEAKGLRELVEAWREVAARHPDAHLWFVGDGPFGPELVDLIKHHELGANIQLTGSFDDVSDVLAAADLFMLPSWEEGLSIALLEAMSAGLPAVVSEIRGNRVLIEHERQGLLVPLRNAAALAAAIERMLTEPELAAQCGTSARQRIEDQYSLDVMADSHCELFERLIAQARR